jgi:hypothetical protein
MQQNLIPTNWPSTLVPQWPETTAPPDLPAMPAPPEPGPSDNGQNPAVQQWPENGRLL